MLLKHNDNDDDDDDNLEKDIASLFFGLRSCKPKAKGSAFIVFIKEEPLTSPLYNIGGDASVTQKFPPVKPKITAAHQHLYIPEA